MTKIHDAELANVHGAIRRYELTELFEGLGGGGSDEKPVLPAPPETKPPSSGPGGPAEDPLTHRGGGLQDPFEG